MSAVDSANFTLPSTGVIHTMGHIVVAMTFPVTHEPSIPLVRLTGNARQESLTRHPVHGTTSGYLFAVRFARHNQPVRACHLNWTLR